MAAQDVNHYPKPPNNQAVNKDSNSIPGFLPDSATSSEVEKHRVRIQKFDLNELGDITELEKIKTLAIQNKGVYLLSQKDFVFMDKMFIMIEYLELDE